MTATFPPKGTAGQGNLEVNWWQHRLNAVKTVSELIQWFSDLADWAGRHEPMRLLDYDKSAEPGLVRALETWRSRLLGWRKNPDGSHRESLKELYKDWGFVPRNGAGLLYQVYGLERNYNASFWDAAEQALEKTADDLKPAVGIGMGAIVLVAIALIVGDRRG